MTFITTKLYGRGANQAYQISTCIATALRYNVDYLIPRFTGGDPIYFNHLELPEFIPNIHHVKYVHKEGRPRYEKIRFRPNMQLDGYWQSFNHFNDFRNEILSLFKWKWELNKGFVSIHVRRGDYINNKAFPLLTDKYYRDAVAYFKQLGYENFLVFSDDIKWCKEYFETFEANFKYSEGTTPQQDMELMSMCEHNITANSSFSVYSAWMNRNEDKIVVCPTARKLFIGVNRDMIPANWKQIEF